ncbi:MAG: c-type cytochrome [Gammaproteobacteria bacterium]
MPHRTLPILGFLTAMLFAAVPALAGDTPAFIPPSEDALADDAFGQLVRKGKDLFVNTGQLRGRYVGNGMKCVNCHLDAGRLADSSPLWAAYTVYPAFRQKTGRVDTFIDRLQGCFMYSMNGTAPPADSPELAALTTYAFWLATNAPVGVSLPGRGYPAVTEPAQPPSIERGAQVYAQNCAICHGADARGTKVGDDYVFPPLAGDDSYNWGAGMHRINTAAAFIKANMPLGKPNSLSDQEAWDVAMFVNSRERPQDPRFAGDLAATRKTHHDEHCLYGDEVDGHVLGSGQR